jgi:hypothetical protein
VEDVNLTINCAGMINGEIVTVAGSGVGSFERGTLGMNFNFSFIPEGFSIYCASLWTACCSTPTFAIERDGGVNMLTLSGGRYRCARRFDFGRYGVYDYNYEIRLDSDNGTMTATGVIHGTVKLPRIVGVEDGFTEVMVPVDPREVRSYSSTSFTADTGERIPVRVEGRYTPLDEDADADWTCCATNQIRKSFIDILTAEGPRLSLEYQTVINGIKAPEPVILNP